GGARGVDARVEVFRTAFRAEHQRLGAGAGRSGQGQRGDREVLAVLGQFHTRLLLEWDSALAGERNIIGTWECGKTRFNWFQSKPVAGFWKTRFEELSSKVAGRQPPVHRRRQRPLGAAALYRIRTTAGEHAAAR